MAVTHRDRFACSMGEFEKEVGAFIGLFTGDNIGKMVVKLA